MRSLPGWAVLLIRNNPPCTGGVGGRVLKSRCSYDARTVFRVCDRHVEMINAEAVTAKSGGQWHLGFPRKNDMDDGGEYRERDHRPASEPAFALTEKARSWQWTRDRPGGERQYDGAVRLTVEQAAVLQSFPPDYPFQGTQTSKFRQIGNAVPPSLAEAVLEAVIG